MQHEVIRTQEEYAEALQPSRRQANARPRIVVAGEFGAGKSSVINAMLRRPFLPYDIGATNRPLIALYNAEDTAIVVTPWAGDPFEVTSFDQIDDQNDVRGLAIRTPMNGLEGVEIVELPFHHDGVVSDGVIEVMAAADVLIWVTIASQAWRLTEKSVVERLPASCAPRMILAVSRSDKLRRADDWDKIESRVRRESKGSFSEIVFMQAATATLTEAGADAEAWQLTGGATLLNLVQQQLGAAASQEMPVPDHARAKAAPAPGLPRKGLPLPGAAASSVVPFDRTDTPAAEAPKTSLGLPGAAKQATPLRKLPKPLEAGAATGQPVFLRSGQTAGAALVAERAREVSSQHVRDSLVRGHGTRKREDVEAEIEEILADASGVDAAGIGDFRSMQVVKTFRADLSDNADGTVIASAICLNSAVGATDFAVPDDYIEEVMVSVGPQSFLIVPADLNAGTFAFLVVQSNRVNPAIMRVLLRRIVALWNEIRA